MTGQPSQPAKNTRQRTDTSKVGSNKFPFVFTPILIVCIGILWCIVKTMVMDRDRWMTVHSRNFEGDTAELRPMRGNILSADGDLMSSSLPNYKVHFDFLSGVPADSPDPKKHAQYEAALSKRDSTVRANIPAIAGGLARICPAALDSAGYVRHLTAGLDARARYFDVVPGYILNYIQYNQLRELPIFNIPQRYANGLVVDERNNRKKPFGSLANRTLGSVYGAKDSASSGLELAYDSVLRGKSGLLHTKRFRGKQVTVVDQEPQDGYDLVSTIDISMQDFCEEALRQQLYKFNASFGVCVLMEVKTGDVKAIVNLEADSTGQYRERRNYAVSALMEPGSTFKTASIMVALDDGAITLDDEVDTGDGLYRMYGQNMKDTSYGRGGHGRLSVTDVVVRSSNIGVSRLIDMHYHDNPRKFIEGLKRVGIGQPLDLPLPDAKDPRIIGPDDKYTYWSGASLPWMSIGYNTMIPPISTVAFYNAIANGGKMVRPRFVKGISRGGQMVEEYPVEVIREQICKPEVLEQVKGILYQVVHAPRGTGKRARSPHFAVAGKTGTAQVAENGHYGREHFVSFVGFYPFEDPQYTCIVSVRTPAPGVGGANVCAPVFLQVAEHVYANRITTDLHLVSDSTAVHEPSVKLAECPATEEGRMPDLTGMGARDAVFAAESRGLDVAVRGYGKVARQSLPAGAVITDGQKLTLTLN